MNASRFGLAPIASLVALVALAALVAGCSASDGSPGLVVGTEGSGGAGSDTRGGGGSPFIHVGEAGNSRTLSAHIERDRVRIEVVTLRCAGECADVEAVASGGHAPYTFAWEDGSESPLRTVCPTDGTAYRVSVTDAGVADGEFARGPETVSAALAADVLECPDSGGPSPHDAGKPPPRDGGKPPPPRPDADAPGGSCGPTDGPLKCTFLAESTSTCLGYRVFDLPSSVAPDEEVWVAVEGSVLGKPGVEVRGGTDCALNEPLGQLFSEGDLPAGAPVCAITTGRVSRVGIRPLPFFPPDLTSLAVGICRR